MGNNATILSLTRSFGEPGNHRLIRLPLLILASFHHAMRWIPVQLNIPISLTLMNLH